MNGAGSFVLRDANVLDVYMSYLRSKLRLGSDEAPIETVRNAGYRLAVRSG